MSEAATAVQIAREVRGAALLDALESIVGSPAIDEQLVTSTVEILQSGSRPVVAGAASTVRALIEGGFLSEAAAEDAIKFLVRRDLIDTESLSQAEQIVNSVNPN
jgi:predicted metal-binding protein